MAQKGNKRYGAWIIVGVILVGLAGFGTGGLSGNIRSIGTVGEKDISVTAYQRALNNQIRTLSAQFGSPISFQQAQAFGIDRAALAEVVLTRTMDNEADQLGISAGDAAVFTRLQAVPSFQGAGGFNRETYRLALQQSGQTAAEFEGELREEIARTLLQGAVISGVPPVDAYADALVQYIGEQRSITWAVVDDAALTAPLRGATPADQQAYYDANPETFTLPEARNITYAWLTPAMIQDQMEVPDSAVEALYQARINEFVQPERRLVERLVYVDAALADAGIAQIEAGEATFEDLVDARGLSLTDIDMGDVSLEELGNAGDAVFAASPGDVVGPFNTQFGPALFRMNAVLAAQETTLDEATSILREELAVEAAREFINDGTDGILDLLAGGATLEDLAERTDLELGTLNWTADVTDGIAAYDAFRNAAAQIEEGAPADIEDLADGGVFTLRLDGVTPPQLQPIDDVRDAVTAAWAIQHKQEAVIARAEEIAADILPLTDFATLDLNPMTETGLTRRSFVEGTPPDFNDELFDMSVGETRVIDAFDRALIVRLDDVAPPDPASDDTVAQRAALAENAAQGIAQDIFEAYATSLQERTELNIDQNTVSAINAQFR